MTEKWEDVEAQVSNDGYLFVSLHKDGREEKRLVHELVAEVFIPNPLGKPFIRHKDGDRTNNHINNLEWADTLDKEEG